MQIAGARALVTGGASGLGAATARRLRAGGAEVTLGDLDEAAGAALAEEIGAAFVRCDVTDAAQVATAVEAARPRICVCCAGIGWAERTVSRRGAHDLDAFGRVVAVNLVGTFNVLRLAAAAMAEGEPDAGGERGVIVVTASIAAFDGQIGQIAYAASKGGVVGMVLPAARDLAGSAIRVVGIAPGLFDTPLLAGLPEAVRAELGATIPHPSRLGDPAEYAALAAHVVENPMLNGEVIRLDGALRMPPK